VRDAEDTQELRIALVMNGGVSLAIWMGGVTCELDAVRRGAGAYGRLLALTRSEARIDVIAGASAGGINGAVLALAIARGTTVRDIRQLWMTNGAIDQLLRDPLERDAPSVLKGDGQLLARLHEAMRAIGHNGELPDEDADRPPLHLTITGTTLHGEVRTYPDRYGAPIPDVDHRARFRFRRPGRPHEGDPWPDDFALRDDDEAAAQLALAARTSASFPGAFEPSFVPVGVDTHDDQHPDMRTIAPDLTASRWMIDGGVLVNTPFRPALDAIRTLPAAKPVRRVLGYVVPNPVPPKAPVDARDEMPSAPEVVLAAVSKLPRVQSIGRELEEIRENNRRVQRCRDARGSTLTTLTGPDLEQVARALLPAYTRTRRQSAVDDVLQLMLDSANPLNPPGPGQLAEVRRRLEEVDSAPWLPSTREYLDWSEVPVEPWQWGFAPVEHAANVGLEVLQRLVALRAEEPVYTERRRLHSTLAKLRETERRSLEYWRAGAAEVFTGAATAARIVEGWARFQVELGARAHEIAHVLIRSRRLVEGLGEEAAYLASMLLGLTGDGRDEEPCLRRLLALDVVQRTSCCEMSGIEQKVELVVMSADAANSFGGPEHAEGKLAGIQGGHFGAFYKSSWRANDWMWGRLDGADRLVRTLLDPVRIQHRLRHESVDAIAAEIQGIACGGRTAPVRDWLREQWRDQPVLHELDELGRLEDEPQAAALPASYAAIRRRVQLEILTEEIPAVRLAVAADRSSEAAAQSRGSRWDAALPRNRALHVDELIDAFKTCPVGQEEIADEIGSDFFTRVSTRAAAVIGSLISGAVSGVKAVKPVAAVIRGVLLTLYLLGRGVTESSRTGAFVVALVLAVGGALVALFALGTHVPGLLLLLGSTILMAGVLLALVRRTGWRILLAALVMLGSVAAWYGVRQWHGRPGWVDPAAGVLAVTLVALGAMALGYKGKRPV
jgi:patatin-related protein